MGFSALVDADQLADGHVESSQVCVIGAGPAGLVVAAELADRGVAVCVVESGSRVPPSVDPLLEGKVVGMPYHLASSRARGLGGSAHMWHLETRTGDLGARFRPLDPEDFEVREWVPHSGWPFGWSEIEGYYQAVHELFASGPWRFDRHRRDSSATKGELPSFDPVVFQIVPAAPFVNGLVATLAASPTCRVLYNASAMELELNEVGSAIKSVQLMTSVGRRVSVEAKLFVIAAGGIETPRLLLLSNSRTGSGLGNAYGLVGRYFMEHPHLTSGVVMAKNDADHHLEPLQFRDQDGARFEIRYALDPGVARSHGIGHLSVGFKRSERDVRRTLRYHTPVAARWSGAYVLHGLKGRYMPPQLGRHLRTILKGLPSLLDGGDEERAAKAPLDRLLDLAIMSEQVPNPASRVTLGRQRDKFGRPLPRLDWRLSRQDVETLQAAQRILLNELEPLGFSVLHDSVSHLDPRLPSGRHYGGGYHHMGTARMHHSPRHGVVDPQSRVHGITNLFIAGSAVFPTSGYANPTMTILALALRLVDHLENQLRPSSTVPHLDT